MSKQILTAAAYIKAFGDGKLRLTGDDTTDLAGTAMCGTENLWVFTPVLATAAGYLGVRNLGARGFRIRVAPALGRINALRKHFPSDWKTPDDGENRFSVVVPADPNELFFQLHRVAVPALFSVSGCDDHLSNSRANELLGCDVAYAIGNIAAAFMQSDGDGAVEQLTASSAVAVNYTSMSHADLVAEVQRRRLPGCNGAKNWHDDTLVSKLVGNDQSKTS